MKTRLLRKLRYEGRNSITILSVTTTDDGFSRIITGMSYSFNEDDYRGLFELGSTEHEVREKACKIWFDLNMEQIRRDYSKYTRKQKLGKIRIR